MNLTLNSVEDLMCWCVIVAACMLALGVIVVTICICISVLSARDAVWQIAGSLEDIADMMPYGDPRGGGEWPPEDEAIFGKPDSKPAGKPAAGRSRYDDM